MYIFELFSNGASGEGDFGETADGFGEDDEFWGGIGDGVENLRMDGTSRRHSRGPWGQQTFEEMPCLSMK